MLQSFIQLWPVLNLALEKLIMWKILTIYIVGKCVESPNQLYSGSKPGIKRIWILKKRKILSIFQWVFAFLYLDLLTQPRGCCSWENPSMLTSSRKVLKIRQKTTAKPLKLSQRETTLWYSVWNTPC